MKLGPRSKEEVGGTGALRLGNKGFPTPEQVGGRILCLAALLRRCDVEAALNAARRQGGQAAEVAAFGREAEEWAGEGLRRWITASGLAGYQSRREAALLGKTVGAWTQQEMIDAGWRLEAAGVLLWAVRRVDALPPWDEEFPRRLLAEEGIMTGDPKAAEAFRRGLALRPRRQLEHARDLAELWHWRSRTTTLQQRGQRLPEGLTFEKVVEMSAQAAAAKGYFTPIGGDFPALGKAYRDLDPEEFSRVTSIAVERHWALNWLCGFAADWDAVPTDT